MGNIPLTVIHTRPEDGEKKHPINSCRVTTKYIKKPFQSFNPLNLLLTSNVEDVDDEQDRVLLMILTLGFTLCDILRDNQENLVPTKFIVQVFVSVA